MHGPMRAYTARAAAPRAVVSGPEVPTRTRATPAAVLESPPILIAPLIAGNRTEQRAHGFVYGIQHGLRQQAAQE